MIGSHGDLLKLDSNTEFVPSEITFTEQYINKFTDFLYNNFSESGAAIKENLDQAAVKLMFGNELAKNLLGGSFKD